MGPQQLLTNVKITKVLAAATSAATPVTSAIVDMQDYEGLVFVCAMVSGNVSNYLSVIDGNQSNLSDALPVSGLQAAAVSDGCTVAVEIDNPQKRYHAAVVNRAVGTVVGDMYAIQFSGKRRPTNNNILGVITAAMAVAPAD